MVQKLALPRKNSTDISVIAAACCISDPVMKMFQLNFNVAHTSRAMSWFGIKLWINDPGTSKLRSHPGLIANGHTGMACSKKCSVCTLHACMLTKVPNTLQSICACMYAQKVFIALQKEEYICSVVTYIAIRVHTVHSCKVVQLWFKMWTECTLHSA